MGVVESVGIDGGVGAVGRVGMIGGIVNVETVGMVGNVGITVGSDGKEIDGELPSENPCPFVRMIEHAKLIIVKTRVISFIFYFKRSRLIVLSW